MVKLTCGSKPNNAHNVTRNTENGYFPLSSSLINLENITFMRDATVPATIAETNGLTLLKDGYFSDMTVKTPVARPTINPHSTSIQEPS